MREIIITTKINKKKDHENQVIFVYDNPNKITEFVQIGLRMRPEKIIIENLLN